MLNGIGKWLSCITFFPFALCQLRMSGILYPSLFQKLVFQDNLFNAFGFCLCFCLCTTTVFCLLAATALKVTGVGHVAAQPWASVLQVGFGTGLKGFCGGGLAGRAKGRRNRTPKITCRGVGMAC